MFDSYTCECMVSIININNDIKEPTHGCQNCNTRIILISGAYFKMKESLYSQIIVWVNTILNHIDTSTILPRYEGPCMVHIYIRINACKVFGNSWSRS